MVSKNQTITITLSQLLSDHLYLFAIFTKSKIAITTVKPWYRVYNLIFNEKFLNGCPLSFFNLCPTFFGVKKTRLLRNYFVLLSNGWIILNRQCWLQLEFFVVTSHLFLLSRSDVFSYGVVLWEIMTQSIPWKDLSSLQVSLSHILAHSNAHMHTSDVCLCFQDYGLLHIESNLYRVTLTYFYMHHLISLWLNIFKL
jgi:hypothetical protein